MASHTIMRLKSPAKTNREQGFTLLELLIASIIFAIMALMAYGGLDNVIDNSNASKQALSRLKQLQQTISILNRDFSQLTPRPIRDGFGNEQLALTAGHTIENAIEFTRGGRVSPPALVRSSLVRVAYRFEEEQFIRLQWPQLDRGPSSEARQSVLLDSVDNITIRFLSQNNEWQDLWPPLNTTATNTTNTTIEMPTAIEIVITLNDWGDIRRLYQVN